MFVVIEPPSDTDVPSIVIALFDSNELPIEPASLEAAIEPANMAFVTPPALTFNWSDAISIELSSTPTARDTELPTDTEPPPDRPSPAVTVTALFASLPFAIEPANIAFVTPDALILNASLFVSIELSSTPTARTPFVADKPSPAIAFTTSETASFLLAFESFASIIAILSFATSTAAAVNSFKSNASDTAPDEPPPESPSPAVTPVISALFEFVIVNEPAASSYDNDIPVPAVNNAFTLSSTLSFV